MTYDVANHLTGVSNAATATYAYDGDGNLVKETSYENVAAGVIATSSGSLSNPGIVTDGDTWADCSACGQHATVASGLHYVQLDLGQSYLVDKVKVWHY
ncbi:MAG: RHS repeat protein, partial [Anaerolineales bacterium]|nr:RHS repeat protein [Anaerolineales bacterium]